MIDMIENKITWDIGTIDRKVVMNLIIISDKDIWNVVHEHEVKFIALVGECLTLKAHRDNIIFMIMKVRNFLKDYEISFSNVLFTFDGAGYMSIRIEP